MRRNTEGNIVLTEQEFIDIVGNELDTVKNLIELYGAETSLMEVMDYLKEKEEC